MHLWSKFDANRTIRLRVIQMAPERDGQTDRQTDRLFTAKAQIATNIGGIAPHRFIIFNPREDRMPGDETRPITIFCVDFPAAKK